jgi:hypothetical protein
MSEIQSEATSSTTADVGSEELDGIDDELDEEEEDEEREDSLLNPKSQLAKTSNKTAEAI